MRNFDGREGDWPVEPTGKTEPIRNLEIKEDKPQPWLDMEREAAYDNIIAESKTAIEGGMKPGQYLKNVIKESSSPTPAGYGWKVNMGNWLTEEQLAKIDLGYLGTDSISRVAGKEIVRPVFIAEKELYDLIAATAGATHSDGIYIQPGRLSGHPAWSKVGVLIVKNDAVSAVHEIRHSIDPHTSINIDQRRNDYDQLIDELFALFEYHIIDGRANWFGLEHKLDSYYEVFLNQSEQKISKEEWQMKIHDLVQKTKALYNKYGEIECQRMIVQARTIDEIMSMN
jgi:hypothetical protein